MSELPPTPDHSPLAPSRVSPPLAVTGLLMLATLFVAANPWFGIRERLWPWEMLAQSRHSLLIEAVLGLWAVTGFWCLGMAFTQSVTVRALGAASLGSVLLIEATGGFGGMTVEDFNLNKMVPMILLGGGLLVARDPPTRGLGRILAGGGAALLIWGLATGFPEGSTDSQLVVFLQELGLALKDPSHDFGRLNHIWWAVIPQTLILIASAGGLLALGGLTQRTLLVAAFVALVLGVFSPGIAGAVLDVLAGGGFRAVMEQFSGAMVGHGGLLWMLGVFTIQDLGKVRALAEVA